MNAYHQQELTSLKDKLLTMASMAETAIHQAVYALTERDEKTAQQVIAGDNELDRLEMEIDDAAVTLLAKAPLAKDLRLIVVAMKISHNLERVGDEATGIAKQALKLNVEPQLKPYIDIPRMAEQAQKMLRDALDAFIHPDGKKARAVLELDSVVDDLHKQLQRELVSYIIESPPNITRALPLMTIAKRLERIADHATNIAEEIVFLHEGQDIRHRH
jgi:phosphate transport system protein